MRLCAQNALWALFGVGLFAHLVVAKQTHVALVEVTDNLQQAIDDAENNTVLQLRSGRFELQQPLLLTKNVTIIGQQTVLVCPSRSRCLGVKHANVTMQNLTFIDGDTTGGEGGCVLIESSVVNLENCTFTNCISNDGGGLFAQSSFVTIAAGTFMLNEAGTQGGAIGCFESTLEITDSVFRDNKARWGGGIWGKESKLRVERGTLSQNVAFRQGGAIQVDWNSDLAVTNSHLASNEAEQGGAIYIIYYCTMVVSSNTVLQENTALWGGGIFASDTSTTQLHGNVTFVGNRADFGGGCVIFDATTLEATGEVLFFDNDDSALILFRSTAVLTSGVTLTGNRGYENGGGIHLEISELYLSNVTMSRNVGSAVPGGGAIFAIYSNLHLGENVVLSENEAVASAGGAISMGFSTLVAEQQLNLTRNIGAGAAAIKAVSASSVHMVNALFDSNHGEYNANVVSESYMVLDSCRFVRNSNSAIEVIRGAQLVVRNSVFEDNSAAGEYPQGGAIHLSDPPHGDGHVTIQGTTFLRNQAQMGGAIHVGSAVEFTLDEAVFHDNMASFGAGVFVFKCQTCSVTASSFTNNLAQIGAGVHLLQPDGEFLVTDSKFEGNYATKEGGGLAAGSLTSLKLRRSVFRGCRANNGGGVATYGEAIAELDSVTLTENEAFSRGGAVFLAGTQASLMGTTNVRGNTAHSAGGIFVQCVLSVLSEALLVLDSNSAATQGGGIVVASGSAELVVKTADHPFPRSRGGIDFKNCTAGDNGGGLVVEVSSQLRVEYATCPTNCQENTKIDGQCHLECMLPACGYSGGHCNSYLANAGAEAKLTCYSNATCSPSMLHDQKVCWSTCVRAMCDWGAKSACHPLVQAQPCGKLVDAVVLLSVRSDPSIVYIKPGAGTAGGLGRCDASGCNASGYCTSLNRKCESNLPGIEYTDCVPEWGECSERPRLPVSAWNYSESELLALLELDLKQLAEQCPDCARVPLSFEGCRAGRLGGGVYMQVGTASYTDPTMCPLGQFPDVLGAPGAVSLHFSECHAGIAGGAVWADFGREAWQLCLELADTLVKLPGTIAGEARVLQSAGNSARGFGSDFAGPAAALRVQAEGGEGMIPGVDAFKALVQLQDIVGNVMRGTPGARLPERVVVSFCANVSGECTTLTALQNALYTFDIAASDIHVDELLLYCPVAGEGIKVGILVDGGALDLEAFSSSHACMPCGPGQSRVETTRGGLPVWSCVECLPGHYSTAPNDAQCSCMRCPEGALCEDGQWRGRLPNMTWTTAGCVLKLESCPQGHRVVGDARSSPEGQRCEPCPAGSQCQDEHCRNCSACPPGSFKAAAAAAPCDLCPANTFRQESGATELAACVPCPAQATTRGALGQRSPDACECDAAWYPATVTSADGRQERVCRPCPAGALCADKARCEAQTDAGAGASARCDLRVCGLTRNGTRTGSCPDMLGEWVSNPEDGVVSLAGCPPGHRLQAYPEQRCIQCPPGFYSPSPNTPDVSCRQCPPRAVCPDGEPPIFPWETMSANLSISVSAQSSEEQVESAIREMLEGMPGVSRVLHVELKSGRRRLRSASSATDDVVVASVVVKIGDHNELNQKCDATTTSANSSGRGSAGLNSASSQAHPQLGAATLSGCKFSRMDEGWAWDAEDLVFRLHSCEQGTIKVNSSIDAQECLSCAKGTYSLHPEECCVQATGLCPACSCQTCPVSVACSDGRADVPQSWDDQGSRTLGVFERATRVDSAMAERPYWALKACPPNTFMLQNLSRPEGDQCVRCPSGQYALGVTNQAGDSCERCPRALNCSGDVCAIHEDYWAWEENCDSLDAKRGEHIVAYRCPADVCEGGTNLSAPCAEGHEGVLCGTCKEGYGWQDGKCWKCSTGRLDVGCYILLGMLLFVAVSYWNKRPRRFYKWLERKGRLPQACAKLLIGYCQVVAGLDKVNVLEWAPALRHYLFRVSQLVSLNLVEALSCFPCWISVRFVHTVFIAALLPVVGFLWIFCQYWMRARKAARTAANLQAVPRDAARRDGAGAHEAGGDAGAVASSAPAASVPSSASAAPAGAAAPLALAATTLATSSGSVPASLAPPAVLASPAASAASAASACAAPAALATWSGSEGAAATLASAAASALSVPSSASAAAAGPGASSASAGSAPSTASRQEEGRAANESESPLTQLYTRILTFTFLVNYATKSTFLQSFGCRDLGDTHRLAEDLREACVWRDNPDWILIPLIWLGLFSIAANLCLLGTLLHFKVGTLALHKWKVRLVVAALQQCAEAESCSADTRTSYRDTIAMIENEAKEKFDLDPLSDFPERFDDDVKGHVADTLRQRLRSRAAPPQQDAAEMEPEHVNPLTTIAQMLLDGVCCFSRNSAPEEEDERAQNQQASPAAAPSPKELFALMQRCETQGILQPTHLEWALPGEYHLVPREEKLALEQAGFLFAEYRVRLWWLELVETVKKDVQLTLLVVFASPGAFSAAAMLLFVLVSSLHQCWLYSVFPSRELDQLRGVFALSPSFILSYRRACPEATVTYAEAVVTFAEALVTHAEADGSDAGGAGTIFSAWWDCEQLFPGHEYRDEWVTAIIFIFQLLPIVVALVLHVHTTVTAADDRQEAPPSRPPSDTPSVQETSSQVSGNASPVQAYVSQTQGDASQGQGTVCPAPAISPPGPQAASLTQESIPASAVPGISIRFPWSFKEGADTASLASRLATLDSRTSSIASQDGEDASFAGVSAAAGVSVTAGQGGCGTPGEGEEETEAPFRGGHQEEGDGNDQSLLARVMSFFSQLSCGGVRGRANPRTVLQNSRLGSQR